MLTENRGSRVALIAYLACEWFVDAMHGHMFSQAAVDIECASAYIALEQLIPRVNFLVRVQCGLSTVIYKFKLIRIVFCHRMLTGIKSLLFLIDS